MIKHCKQTILFDIEISIKNVCTYFFGCELEHNTVLYCKKAFY